MKQPPPFFWLAIGCCLMVCTCVFAAVDITQDSIQMTMRRKLAGLTGIKVFVEAIDPEVERDGLTRAQLQTDVELRLRKAGIKVFTDPEWQVAPSGSPVLGVQVTLTKHRILPQYIYHIEVAVYQAAYLARDGSLATATVWKSGSVGTVGVDVLRYMRSFVADSIDEFVNDFLAANPDIVSRREEPSRHQNPSPQVLIRQVQERLQMEGFYRGFVDGVFGPQTREALRQYQKTRALSVTGELDAATLQSLRVE